MKRKKSVRENLYTDIKTLSPVSLESSKLTIDTQESNTIKHIHVENIIHECSGIDDAVNQNCIKEKVVSNINNIADKKLEKNEGMQIHNVSVNKETNDDTEYIFESKVGHKTKQKSYTIEVKWKDFSETLWETFVCDDVTTYIKNLKGGNHEKKVLKPIINK